MVFERVVFVVLARQLSVVAGRLAVEGWRVTVVLFVRLEVFVRDVS